MTNPLEQKAYCGSCFVPTLRETPLPTLALTQQYLQHVEEPPTSDLLNWRRHREQLCVDRIRVIQALQARIGIYQTQIEDCEELIDLLRRENSA